MSKSTPTPAKVKIASLVLGVMSMFWLVLCVISFNSLLVHEILFRIGAGLSCFLLALETNILFHAVSLTSQSLRSIPQVSPLSWALMAVSLLCYLFAGIAYLIS